MVNPQTQTRCIARRGPGVATALAAFLLAGLATAVPASAGACSNETLQQREVMREALSDVAKRGLRGKHHYSISFLTTANGVALPSALAAQYPRQMTIILQHQFKRLRVSVEEFEVALWFKGAPARVTVPFNAVTLFVDPSVNVWIKPDPTSHGQRCQNARAAQAASPTPCGSAPGSRSAAS
jgi:hypothetical protein